MMRRWYLPLLLAYAVAITLVAARSASRNLVYESIYQQSLNNWYGTPGTASGEIVEPFATTLEHLQITKPIGPWFPVVRVVGLIDAPAIFALALLVGVISLLWTGRQRSATPPTPNRIED